MSYWKVTLLVVSLIAPQFTYGRFSSFPAVDKDLSEYDGVVAKLRADFAIIPANPKDIGWVKAKLNHMVEVDQYMRKFGDVIYAHKYSSDETKYFWVQFGSRWQDVDGANTVDVKWLLEIYEWFTTSKFGTKAESNGWLIVQHADHDRQFQKRILVLLERFYKIGETQPANYAYLYDRVAVGDKCPQRYATQGRCVGAGKWEPDEVEDIINVDKRRAEMGLQPLEEYKAVFKDICKKAEG